METSSTRIVIGALGSGASIFLVFAAIDAQNLPMLFPAGVLTVGVFATMPVAVGAAYYPEMFPPATPAWPSA